MKRFYRMLSLVLCVALLLPAVATIAFAVTPATGSRAATPNAPAELESLSSYLHASVSTEDNTSHLHPCYNRRGRFGVYTLRNEHQYRASWHQV